MTSAEPHIVRSASSKHPTDAAAHSDDPILASRNTSQLRRPHWPSRASRRPRARITGQPATLTPKMSAALYPNTSQNLATPPAWPPMVLLHAPNIRGITRKSTPSVSGYRMTSPTGGSRMHTRLHPVRPHRKPPLRPASSRTASCLTSHMILLHLTGKPPSHCHQRRKWPPQWIPMFSMNSFNNERKVNQREESNLGPEVQGPLKADNERPG